MNLETGLETVRELGDNKVVPTTHIEPVVGPLSDGDTYSQSHASVTRVLDTRWRKTND